MQAAKQVLDSDPCGGPEYELFYQLMLEGPKQPINLAKIYGDVALTNESLHCAPRCGLWYSSSKKQVSRILFNNTASKDLGDGMWTR
jgi:hypothetical protein